MPDDFTNPYPGGKIAYRDIDCAFCGGTGKHPDTGGWSNTAPKPCPVCRGIGTVNASSNASTCRYCDGSGREPGTGGWSNKESQPCTACSGKGIQK
jgi:DnaJ-class molecular chaperone